jgi:hypothetical protein
MLSVALATACSKPAEQQAAETEAPADETAAQNADAPGTTTTFEETTPEPRQ